MSFLQDRAFLLKLNQHPVREYLAAITVLDFETENPIARIEGRVVSGNMSIAANSSVRRTASLSLICDAYTYNVTDVTNLISIDKKVGISVGFTNPFYNDGYANYGEELFFPQGIFFVTRVSSSYSTGNTAISVELIDKMGGLNGTVGGVLQQCVTFHEKAIENPDGTVTKQYPLIKDIIYEAVNHFGKEHASRIFVDDVPETGLVPITWRGTSPLQYYTSSVPGGGISYNYRVLSTTANNQDGALPNLYKKGDLIGSRETPLIWPGELILQAGATVTSLLDQIVQTLGNYEYFYDVEGNFHFQAIKNFRNAEGIVLNWDDNEELRSLYLPYYGDTSYLNEFEDSTLITQIGLTPDFSNIKNDFVVWGTRNDKSNTSQTQKMVRYHLALDVRPVNSPDALCKKTIYKITRVSNNQVVRYSTSARCIAGEKSEMLCLPLSEYFPNNPSAQFNWREELYRRALLAYGTSTTGSDYDEELRAEWRDLYDPSSAEFKIRWEDHYGVNAEPRWTGYNLDVQLNSTKVRYWLDIIDTGAEIGKFSVNRIGRRSKVENNSKINTVFKCKVPDIIWVPNPYGLRTADEIQQIKARYNSIGQPFLYYNPDDDSRIADYNDYGSCYEIVRGLLYQHLLYNNQVSMQTIPIFYLEPNHVIRLNLPAIGIVGDYVIKNISWGISNGGTMSLTLNEVVTEV